MRVAAALVTAAWLVACSGAEQQQSAAATGNAAEPAEPAPAAVSATGSGMRGTVSSLTGAVSGLNTRVTDMGLVIDLPSDALFEFDKATLTPAAEDQLRKATDLIRRSPPGALKVIGHTDDKGDDAYNQKLSVARAQAVADWLGQQVGVRTRGFEVSGKGESEPVAPNARPDGSDDPAGRAKNRRVELVVPNGG
ncbi:OmpA family protein [Sphingomonas sp. Y38-1Y]|uniref:OmpA family protein n=1 Tax=Sphingomonas sp. Y38-1Y TaxID=3078265 RepID=UPI0028EDEEE1|nr:OmpA family protein [Sphingomonas sp. Y38-1Y]